MIAKPYIGIEWVCKIFLVSYLVGIPLLSRTTLSPVVTGIGICLSVILLCVILLKAKLPFSISSWVGLSFFACFGIVVYVGHFDVDAPVGHRAIAVVYLILIGFGVAAYVAKWGPNDVLKYLVIGVSVGSIWALVTAGNIVDIRSSTPFGGAINQYGSLIGFAVFGSLYLSDRGTNKRSAQWVWMLVAVGLSVMSVLIGSRQSLILCVIAWGYYIGFSPARIILVGIISYPIFMFAAEMEVYIVERINSLLAIWFGLGETGEQSIPLRMALLSAAIEGWAQRPLVGHGVQAFQYFAGFGIYTHMNYTELLFNHGIIGFFLYYIAPAGILLMVLSKRNKVRKDVVHVVVFVVMYSLVRDAFIVTYHDHLTWVVYGLLVGLMSYRGRKRMNREPT